MQKQKVHSDIIERIEQVAGMEGLNLYQFMQTHSLSEMEKEFAKNLADFVTLAKTYKEFGFLNQE